MFGWWREREVRLPPTFFAVPPLLVIYPWQYNIFRLAESTWQLSDIEGATSVFGLHYLYDNVGHALNFFFTFDGSQPNSWLLALVGLPAVGFSCCAFLKNTGSGGVKIQPRRLSQFLARGCCCMRYLSCVIFGVSGIIPSPVA